MPENVPPKETAKADALNPAEQAPGVPRGSMVGPASAAAPAGDLGPSPGPEFVKIRWKEKIGGDEADVEWAERRRAENLVGSGHAEIVKDDEK